MNGKDNGGRRVAVTGIGVVSACGTGAEAFWEGLFRTPPDGHRELTDWDPSPWMEVREARHTDRFTQFAVAAADMAHRDAGLTEVDAERSGVVVATALAGVSTFERQSVIHHERGGRRVSPFLVPMMMANAAAATVAMRQGWRGPCESLETACAAATHAIGHAARMIADGTCDRVLAGGTEAAITPTIVAGFTNMRALSSTGRTRPFDAERDGFAIAEGAAVLVLEDWDTAVARGATLYGEVLGSASTADAHDITMPAPGGGDAARCIRLALEDAGVRPQDVRQINAHGTGTLRNDEAETNAILSVFEECPPVTSTKGATGHAFGAGGALEAVAVLLSMRHGRIPPTVGLTTVDPALAVDVVTGEGRTWQPGPALTQSFGFGGHNGVLVLGPAG
ncbi:beta-ketoacyl synthase [Streptomyces virginiae]|uniref:Beta-ketoacyl synthase n=1 Tax=Streptomyces virginiae TaxID=1961 RepID=A0A0L8MXC0_STRVG|nr:beta-ketoacyl-[acyl-carrier-protein] synthase family protein [Streptomyces virginiae]KOG55064.1 beta-ketoacyl synthase [Streptomyces virginiae]